MNKNLLPLLLLVLAFSSCSEKQPRYPEPLAVEEALKHFTLDDRFEIETYVSEPDIKDPVDLVFDEWGNAYVVEMPDYPNKVLPGQGRIRKLVDKNGDGQVDEVHLFADSLLDATSVLPWKGGLIVTAAPLILYLKDTNGDHRADSREILFSGFFDNNSEAQITNLRYGVDNWIYANNRGQHGEVKYHRKPDAPALNMQGADFRFRLDQDKFELETGPGQFGQALNDWNHRFVTENTIHIQQSIIPRRYLTRHDHLPELRAIQDISDHGLPMYQLTPAPYWRQERSRRRQEQYDQRGLDRTEYVEDHFTGASGGTHYGSELFPDEFYGNIFTAEVAGNLLHRDVLVPHPDAPHYIARRAPEEQDREFLAADDMWFRPVATTVGPDGCLYLIDMYRQHIETPLSIPEDLKEDMDFDYGKEHGRIYRIKPKGHARPAIGVVLGELSAAELVPYLAHGDQWWRLQAQRLLIERQSREAVPAVRGLLEHADARARLHALYVLKGLEALQQADVALALEDAHPGVREHGLMLSEAYPALLPQAKELALDTNNRVSLQATLSLGAFPAEKVLETLAGILERHGSDNWYRLAVLSSDAGSSLDLLRELIRRDRYFAAADKEKLRYLEDLGYILGSRNKNGEAADFAGLLGRSPLSENEQVQLAGLQGLERGLQASKKRGGELPEDLREVLTGLQANAGSAAGKQLAEILKLWE